MTSTIDVLNRLYVAHARSLPSYLSYAMPWLASTDARAWETVVQVAVDQRRMADRLGEMIMDLGGAVDPGEYPLKYTALHDLSFEYLLGKVIEGQTQLVPQLQAGAEQLTLVPLARSLAEEAVGEAKGHLESLRELLGKTAHS